MKFRTILSLVVVFVACFALSNRAAPVYVQQASFIPQPTFHFLSAMDNPTAQGKILSVGDASFTLETKKSQDTQAEQFMIDENTKVEGKLAAGAQAVVEYRSEGGKKIATHVIVHAPAGQ